MWDFALILLAIALFVTVGVGRNRKWKKGKFMAWVLIVIAGWFFVVLQWQLNFGSAMHQAGADVALRNLGAIPSDVSTRLGWTATSLGLNQVFADLAAGLSSGDFSSLISYWPLALVAIGIFLAVIVGRWLWSATRPTPAATTGTSTSGTTSGAGVSLQTRLVNLGLEAAALAVLAVVVVLVLRWTGFGQPSGRPSLNEDRRTLAARLVDAEELRAYQGVNFLPVLPALDASGNVTITGEIAEGMLTIARDQLIPIEQLDQRAKTPITQDVRDYVVTWVEALTLRLDEVQINPLSVPGYLGVYLKARTLEARGLSMQGSHQWVIPPPVGGEVEKVLTLANRVAVLKVWVEDLEARNADPSVPPPTLKERQGAQAEAMAILADCESSRLMLNLGAQVPFAQTYDPVYTDNLLWNFRGEGLCNWAEALRDRLR